MKKLSVTLFAFFFFVTVGGVIFPSSSKAAETTTFQTLDANQCHTYNSFGFTSGTGCATGETCVMSSSGAGYVPTCMPTLAATSVNYAYATDCYAACGHTCILNPLSYAGTYFCGPDTTPAATTQTTAAASNQTQTTQGFTALAPIPGLTDTSATSVVNANTLANFFNNLYKYLIGLAAILAVIEIIWGGLQISTQDSVSKQGEGRERITQAVLGLVLVLSPVLVFSIINPSILNLSLSLPELKLSTTPTTTAVPVSPVTNASGTIIFNEGWYAASVPSTYCFTVPSNPGGNYYCASDLTKCTIAQKGVCPVGQSTCSGLTSPCTAY